MGKSGKLETKTPSKMANFCDGSGDPRGSKKVAKQKGKREPLPMKMRALPQSFWLEPNTSRTILSTSYCSPMEEEANGDVRDRTVGKANTDLLFSLFHSVCNHSDRERPVRAGKRGRPRKENWTNKRAKTSRDDDPYFTSAIFPAVQSKVDGETSQEQQVLALISVSATSDNRSTSNAYSERLSNLVINL